MQHPVEVSHHHIIDEESVGQFSSELQVWALPQFGVLEEGLECLFLQPLRGGTQRPGQEPCELTPRKDVSQARSSVFVELGIFDLGQSLLVLHWYGAQHPLEEHPNLLPGQSVCDLQGV